MTSEKVSSPPIKIKGLHKNLFKHSKGSDANQNQRNIKVNTISSDKLEGVCYLMHKFGKEPEEDQSIKENVGSSKESILMMLKNSILKCLVEGNCKETKAEDVLLSNLIHTLLKGKNYRASHRLVITDIVNSILRPLAVTGKDRLDEGKLSRFVQSILSYGRFASGYPRPKDILCLLHDYYCHLGAEEDVSSVPQTSSDYNMGVDKLCQVINEGIALQIQLTHNQNTFTTRPDYEEKKELISDEELDQFYKYLLCTVAGRYNKDELREFIIDHGDELKEAGIIKYDKNFKKIGKEKRPLYRPQPDLYCTKLEETYVDHSVSIEKFKKDLPTEILEILYTWEKKVKQKDNKEISSSNKGDQMPATTKEIIQPIPTADGTSSININQIYSYKTCLNKGEYASVRVYYSRILKKDVAIKIISKVKLSKEQLLKFVPRELSVLLTVKHQNIIKCIEVFENELKFYIVMELAEKGNLTKYIKERGRLDSVVYRKFFAQLADAVCYCLEQGVFHRKISCDNILVTKSNNIKLCDFSFAREADAETDLYSTHCGVLAFTAPEILQCQIYSPYLTEVWSVGVVVYAMVYGALPFVPDNYFSLLRQVNGKIKFKRYPDTPYAVIKLMHNMISPLNRRYSIWVVVNDPWLINQASDSTIKEQQKSKVYIKKPWDEKRREITNLKQKLDSEVMKNISTFVTGEKLEKLQRKQDKKRRNEYIPNAMQWLFRYYNKKSE